MIGRPLRCSVRIIYSKGDLPANAHTARMASIVRGFSKRR